MPKLVVALNTRPCEEPWEPGAGSPRSSHPAVCSRENRIQTTPTPRRPICPAFCPLPSATPAGAQTRRAAGARRGGGPAMTQNHTRPHLRSPAGLRHSPPGHPRLALPFGSRDGRRGGRRGGAPAEGREAAPGMSFLAGPRTRANRGPLSGPPSKDAAPQRPGRGPRPEAAAPSPAPPSGPARRARQAPAPARRRLGARSRPRPGPAYPGRCSPHTPPLAAPSGTSSAATRPQPSGPAWGARAAGPGGGGPCCPARLRQGPG